MAGHVLNRFDLSHYRLLVVQAAELNEKIRLIEDELSELEKCCLNISPVISGMPSGNIKSDKIANFVIKLEKDRDRLINILESYVTERSDIMYRLYKVRSAVKKIPNKQLRNVIRWYYIDGLSAIEIAKKTYLTRDAVYKKIDRFLGLTQKRKKE